MNFDLDENQELFKAAVERFCAGNDVLSRHSQRRQPGGLDRARWRELADLGLIALATPDSAGGLGGSLVDCAIVAQALGYGLAVEPWLECGFLPARLHADAALIDGSRVTAVAFAEPGSRYRLDAQGTTVRDGKISGEKTLVLCGGAADTLIVTASAEGETKLFALDAQGVDLRPYPAVDGSIAATAALRAAEAGSPVGNAEDWQRAVDEARLMAAAEMVGIGHRLLDETLAYVKQREQFGQPIGRFQVVQHRLVDAYAKVEAAQSSLWRALLLPGTPAESIKAFVAEQVQWVAEQAVQLHGGMGMTDELTIGHGLKRILLLSRLFGDPSSGLGAMAKAA